MNHDERFHQRWEFRRREVDEDTSSDDNGSNSSAMPADRKHNLVTDLVLLENDEANDSPGCQRHDKLDTYNSIHSQTVKANEKRKLNQSRRMWNVVHKNSEGHAFKGSKRKRKLDTSEMVVLKDLKIFADSLVHELTVARQNMFAHMREEMRKLLDSRSNLEPVKKNVRRSQKKKVCPQNGIESGVKPQNCSGGSMCRDVENNVASDTRKFSKAVAEPAKHDQVLELTTTNELHKGDRLRTSTMVHMNISHASDQVVSSSYIALPTILPNPQFQNQRNHIHLNYHIPPGVPMNNSGSEIEIGKLMAAKKFSHRFAEERFGSVPQSCHKSMGLLGQNSSQTAIQGFGFPIPFNQGTDSGSNMSSLTYCENSFMKNNRVGLRMNGSIARFPGTSPSSSERMFRRSIINNMPHKTNGEFVPTRSQDLKDGQFYLTSLRK